MSTVYLYTRRDVFTPGSALTFNLKLAHGIPPSYGIELKLAH